MILRFWWIVKITKMKAKLFQISLIFCFVLKTEPYSGFDVFGFRLRGVQK